MVLLTIVLSQTLHAQQYIYDCKAYTISKNNTVTWLPQTNVDLNVADDFAGIACLINGESIKIFSKSRLESIIEIDTALVFKFVKQKSFLKQNHPL